MKVPRQLRYTVLALGFSFFLTFLNLTISAQEIRTKALLDTTQILAGDQIKLRLELEIPEGMKVSFPTPPDSLTNAIEILSRASIDTQKIEKHRLLLSQDFLITAFDSGNHVIPAFHFELIYDELSEQISGNELQLTVHSLPVNQEKGPVDIAMPYEAPLTFSEVAPWIFGILLVIAVIILIIYGIMRKKMNKTIFYRPQKPKEPAHIVALRELEQIKHEELWQHNKVKEHYTKITDVLRIYIEERFNVHTLEKTSEEIMNALRDSTLHLDQQPLNELKQVFKTADLVKFAKFIPQPDVNNLMMLNAFLVVEQTKLEARKQAEAPIDDREGEEVILK